MVMKTPNESSPRALSPTLEIMQQHDSNNNSTSSPRKFRFRRRRSDGISSSVASSSSQPFSASLRKRMKRFSTMNLHQKARSNGTSATDVLLEDSRDEPPTTIRTSILGSYEPTAGDVSGGDTDEDQLPELCSNSTLSSSTEPSCNATAILQHSSTGCGKLMHRDTDEQMEQAIKLTEDPSVEESFECVFASQLEEGLPHDALWEERGNDEEMPEKELISPAMLHQSRSSCRLREPNCVTPKPYKPRRTFRTGSLVHIGTYDPVADCMSTQSPTTVPDVLPEPEPEPPKSICPCCSGKVIPQLSPQDWPQAPLLFRPTPGSGMRVKGVKFANAPDYLWKVGDEHTWVQALHHHWGRPEAAYQDLGCPECMILPINNGNEAPSESLVVDFVSQLFEGSILVRVRHSNGSTVKPYNDDVGYFAGVNRRYQVVIQGKPTKSIPVTECVTGWELNHPCGKLPPKWILKGALKLVSFFAPQLVAVMDGPKPKTISPLGSTPQMLKVHDDAADLEANQEEPTVDEEALLGVASHAKTTLARAKFRKKNFDKLYQQQSKTPVLSPANTYTFEFLQHLLNFTDFTVELGSMLGSIPLKDVLNGQALQIMAKHNTMGALWSFDVWHEELYADAQKHELS